MSFPNKVMNQIYLSEQDKKDILFGIKNDVEYIACSFVSQAQDVIDVKNFIKENNNGVLDIGLISKIENRAGIENIEAICAECEGIMIGRGDLGVEIPFEEVPQHRRSLLQSAVFSASALLPLPKCWSL
jgi:pyruvate kinase